MTQYWLWLPSAYQSVEVLTALVQTTKNPMQQPMYSARSGNIFNKKEKLNLKTIFFNIPTIEKL
jgi:hypothetical protein